MDTEPMACASYPFKMGLLETIRNILYIRFNDFCVVALNSHKDTEKVTWTRSPPNFISARIIAHITMADIVALN